MDKICIECRFQNTKVMLDKIKKLEAEQVEAISRKGFHREAWELCRLHTTNYDMLDALFDYLRDHNMIREAE